MRTMYDSVDAASVPQGAQLVAGYVDGHYRSYPGMVAKFPNLIHVPIAVFASTNNGVVLDCEAGDATPAQAPGWVKMRRAAGIVRPTIYTPTSQVAAVRQACAAAGLVQRRDYELWTAHYDNRPTPDGYGEAAKQYIDHGPHGENIDMSAVFDDAWPYYQQGDDVLTPEEHAWLGDLHQIGLNEQGFFGQYLQALQAIEAKLDQLVKNTTK